MRTLPDLQRGGGGRVQSMSNRGATGRRAGGLFSSPLAVAGGAEEDDCMKFTPINMAEAIFEPFWDPQLSGLPRWQVTTNPEAGAQVKQDWCWVKFEWARRPAQGPVLRMTRRFQVPCAGYDRLLVSAVIPQGALLRVTVSTEKGEICREAEPKPNLEKEYEIDLRGASWVDTVTLELVAMRDGVGSGWFNWLGLQNSVLLERYLAQWTRFDATWEPYLLHGFYSRLG
jgi:hypothetical protein